MIAIIRFLFAQHPIFVTVPLCAHPDLARLRREGGGITSTQAGNPGQTASDALRDGGLTLVSLVTGGLLPIALGSQWWS